MDGASRWGWRGVHMAGHSAPMVLLCCAVLLLSCCATGSQVE